MRRGTQLLAAAALAAGALAGCSGKSEAPDAAAGQGAQAMPAEPAIPEDPAEVRRKADLEEARGRFRSLREAFAHGGRASSASRARLEAALRAASGTRPLAWKVACRARVCAVTGQGPAGDWQPLVLEGAPVLAVADRLAADPDGADATVYALLAEQGAAPGDALLEQVATALVASSDARGCAARERASGTVEYELRVDPSGFTYRTDGDLPWPVVDCVNDVLHEIMREVQVPPNAKSATRKVALRL